MELSCPKLLKSFYILRFCEINNVTLKRQLFIFVRGFHQKNAKFSKREIVSYNY